jgi:hypothetical protein
MGTRTRSRDEFEFVVRPNPKRQYPERGGDFAATHPSWCLRRQARLGDSTSPATGVASFVSTSPTARQARLGNFSRKLDDHNRRLREGGHPALERLELVGGRLYTGGPLFITTPAAVQYILDPATTPVLTPHRACRRADV